MLDILLNLTFVLLGLVGGYIASRAIAPRGKGQHRQESGDRLRFHNPSGDHESPGYATRVAEDLSDVTLAGTSRWHPESRQLGLHHAPSDLCATTYSRFYSGLEPGSFLYG